MQAGKRGNECKKAANCGRQLAAFVEVSEELLKTGFYQRHGRNKPLAGEELLLI